MLVLSVTQGFITNSSSAVHAFDMRLLEVPEVKTFMQKFGITRGFVGRDMWMRGSESSLLLTTEQKEEAREDKNEYGGGEPPIPMEAGVFVLVYCDESDSIVSEFCRFLEEFVDKAVKSGEKYEHYQDEYN
jgi:hypothetical protein